MEITRSINICHTFVISLIFSLGEYRITCYLIIWEIHACIIVIFIAITNVSQSNIRNVVSLNFYISCHEQLANASRNSIDIHCTKICTSCGYNDKIKFWTWEERIEYALLNCFAQNYRIYNRWKKHLKGEIVKNFSIYYTIVLLSHLVSNVVFLRKEKWNLLR